MAYALPSGNTSCMTHTISFQPDPYGECGEILAYIDGTRITHIISEYERESNPSGRAHDKTSRDGGIPLDEIQGSFEHTVCDRVLQSSQGVILLVCDCGYSSCSSTKVDIEVTDTQIIWSNLRTWISKYEPYADFGPWMFNRTQYQSACDELYERSKINP